MKKKMLYTMDLNRRHEKSKKLENCDLNYDDYGIDIVKTLGGRFTCHMLKIQLKWLI